MIKHKKNILLQIVVKNHAYCFKHLFCNISRMFFLDRMQCNRFICQQMATGQSLKFASCWGDWGERSCPRSATAIYSVAVDSSVASPTRLGGQLFCNQANKIFGLGHRFSKHKTTRYDTNLGAPCPPWLRLWPWIEHPTFHQTVKREFFEKRNCVKEVWVSFQTSFFHGNHAVPRDRSKHTNRASGEVSSKSYVLFPSHQRLWSRRKRSEISGRWYDCSERRKNVSHAIRVSCWVTWFLK